MTGENLESTVLHEHRKVVTFRHLLAIVNFIAILVGTLVTKHFVLIRGSSDSILMTINLLWIINIVQILLCLADYILKVFMGRYSGLLVKISYGVGLLWLGVVVLQTVIGSVELGEIRLDLLVISALQLLTALIAYIIWPSLDHAAIQAMTHQNVRDNKTKRARKARRGVVNYVLVCIFMIAIQAGMLFAYKIPPKVYDLFAESRALQYQENADGTGYEVIGIYKGTSSYVNVPAVYNNKPVTKIAKGALSDLTLLEQYKISTIEIGTPVVDENGNTVYESNVSVIEAGAIANNKITTLKLPISVLKIEDGAIESSSLKTLVYGAKADFSYSILSCTALSTITFEGEDVGKIVSLEGMGNSVTIEVAKDIYNTYREKNREYMQSLRPILADNEFVVDFYTGTDYYIESIFGEIGNKVLVGYQDLKNDLLTDKTSLAVDTLAYIKNKHETGTAGARADSAFRGWYYDRSYAEECLFDEESKVEFTRDTAIYAKWIDEYTGNLDWGTYHPDGQAEVLYWTDEDLVTFPVIEGRVGYTEGINWYLDDSQVTNSQSISKSVTLRGEWLFDKPTVDIEPYAQNSEDTSFVISTDKNTVSFIYDESQTVSLDAIMSHGLDGEKYNGIEFGYATDWVKVDDNSYSKADRTVRLQNVSESGEYILTVTAKSPYGEESTSETRISVNIAKKDINLGDARLENFTGIYNSVNQYATHAGTVSDERIKVTYTYFDESGAEVSVNDGVKNVGRYTVKALFEKNNPAEAANYETKELVAEFIIAPRELGFDSWSATNFVYNANAQSVYLNLTGVYAGDVVNIVYENGSNVATDAGKYVAKATGITNPNYSIGEIRDNCTHTWEIAPMEVSIKEWLLDGSTTSSFKITYNGELHTLTAVPEGIYTSDLGKVNFLYEENANTVSAVNANKYTAKIVGVDNGNYVFNGVSTQSWEIEKRTVTVSFESLPKVFYNGKNQFIKATVSGIVEKDLAGFAKDDFLYVGKSDALSVSAPVIDGGNIEISFGAKNAASYTAAVSGINTASDENLNYKIVNTTKSFEIEPKAISFINTNSYTYNGKYQLIGIKVSGIAQEDLSSVKLDQFTSSVAENGSVVGSDYVISFNAKDAGSYDIDVTAFNNPNYTMTSFADSIKIAKKVLSVDWKVEDLKTNALSSIKEADELTYNYSGYNVVCDIIGVVNGETINLNYSNESGKNAGSYKTTVSLPSEYTNYSFNTSTLNWKITPYVLDFEWTFNGTPAQVGSGKVPSFVYSANEVKVEPVFKTLGDDVVTVSYESGKADLLKTNASTTTYKVKISALSSSNYAIGKASSFEWKIDPKPIVLTWTTDGLTTGYNGQYHGAKFNITGLIETEDRYIPVYLYYASDDTEVKLDNLVFDSSSMNSENYLSCVIDAGDYVVRVGSLCKISGGSYTETVDTNYSVSADSFDISIAKAPVTLNGWQYTNGGTTSNLTSTSNLIYNKSTYTLTNSIKSGIFSRSGIKDSVSLSYSDGVNSAMNANSYEAKVDLIGSHANNYYIASGDIAKWTIKPKTVSVSWVSNSFVFSGSAKTQSATYKNGASSTTDLLLYDGDSLIIAYDGNIKTDAGAYTAEITSIGNDNYVLRSSDVSYEWKIDPQPVKLTWSANRFTYNGGIQYPTAQFSSSVYVSEYEKENTKNAGTYSIKALKLNDDNYVIDSSSTGYHTYVIDPIIVNFTWGFGTNTSNAESFTYDGSSRVLNAYVANACKGDSIVISYNVTDRTVKNAKTYTVSVTGIDNKNYLLNTASTGTTKTITVSPRTIDLTWGFNGSTSGAQGYIYDGTEKTIAAYASNICSGDVIKFTYSSISNLKLKNVGDYEFKVLSCDNPNYVLPTVTTKTVTVEKKELRFDFYFGTNRSNTAGNYSYDGVSKVLNAAPTAATLCAGDKVEVVFNTTNRTLLNAKDYSFSVIDLTGEDAGNYKLPSTSNCNVSITVTKQTLSISWSSNTSVVYDGTMHSLEATLKGINNGSVVKFTPIYKDNTNGYVDANTGSNSYTVTVVGFDGTDSSNYTLPSSAYKNLTIKPQPVKITWSGETNVVYDGKNHALTAIVVGSTDSKPVSFTYSNNQNSFVNANSYNITVNLQNTNYTTAGVSASKTLVISPATATIVWPTSTSFVYDGQGHSLIPTAYGINGSTLSGISYTTTSQKDVGSRTYEVTALNNSNYKLPTDGSAKKTLVITAQPVEIVWATNNTQAYQYGKTLSLVATVKGQLDGVSVPFLYVDGNSLNSVGTKTVKIASLANANYTLDGYNGSLSATLTVTPQKVTISWTGNETIPYDGQYHFLGYTVVGNDGHEITANVTGSQYGKDAGTYTCTINSLNDSNYTLDGCTGNRSQSLVIAKRQLTVVWNGVGDINYDGLDHEVSATVKDEYGSDVLFSYYSETTFSAPGTYYVSIRITGLDSKNYEVVSGSLTAEVNIKE